MGTEQKLSDSLEPVAVDASSRLIVDLARRGATLVAQNTGWATSPDSVAIAAAAAEVAAFPLAANSTDSALLLSLSPGSYTVQISSPDNTTGTALLEVYELR